MHSGTKATTTFYGKKFSKFVFCKKKFDIFLRMKNGIYRQKNTLIGKRTWFSFGHEIQIGDAKALAL